VGVGTAAPEVAELVTEEVFDGCELALVPQHIEVPPNQFGIVLLTLRLSPGDVHLNPLPWVSDRAAADHAMSGHAEHEARRPMAALVEWGARTTGHRRRRTIRIALG
jgi:NAD(P)H-dependent flavin oxidoreductase YrpB (nitropropane dioxygenase family)